MANPNCLLVLTHVVCQSLYRWAAPPDVPAGALVDQPLEGGRPSLNPRVWYDWVLQLSEQFPACLPAEIRCGDNAEYRTRLCHAVTIHLRASAAAGAECLTIDDARYPTLLRSIADPPHMLTVQGNLAVLKMPMIAVVGSRKASAYALERTAVVSRFLADHGYAVVSGGAYGCDIAAHRGVLTGRVTDCPALVVFAGGLCQRYPDGNDYIFREILRRGGTCISERLWHKPARAMDFPVRNRIVSGVAFATLVMQAAARSGAVSTANQALRQGREVFVLEHPRDDVRAEGSHKLQDEGAACFIDTETLVVAIHDGAAKLAVQVGG